MRFDVSSTALLSRLQAVGKVIASKNTLPILDNFLFQLEGNVLTVTASDVETRLVTSVEVMNALGFRALLRLGEDAIGAFEGIARAAAYI